MKTVKSMKTEEVIRVTDEEANKLVSAKTHQYVSKSEYKKLKKG